MALVFQVSVYKHRGASLLGHCVGFGVAVAGGEGAPMKYKAGPFKDMQTVTGSVTCDEQKPCQDTPGGTLRQHSGHGWCP